MEWLVLLTITFSELVAQNNQLILMNQNDYEEDAPKSAINESVLKN